MIRSRTLGQIIEARLDIGVTIPRLEYAGEAGLVFSISGEVLLRGQRHPNASAARPPMIHQALQGTSKPVDGSRDAIQSTTRHSHIAQQKLQYTVGSNSLSARTTLTGTGGEDNGTRLAILSGGSIGATDLLEGKLVGAGDFHHLVIGIAGEVPFQKLEDAVCVLRRGSLAAAISSSRICPSPGGAIIGARGRVPSGE